MSTSSHASFFTRSVQFPFLFLASILFFLSLLPAFAQEAPEQESRGVVSPVSVSDVKVLEGNKQRLIVQATFTNTSKTKPVTGVYTTVALLEKSMEKKIDGETSIIGFSTFDEVKMEDLFLAPGESSTRKMTYSPPSFAKGSYELRVFVRDSVSGRELAYAYMPSEMPFIGTGAYISLSDCFITVKGEEEKYGLGEGVDIDANETLLLNCTAENRTGAPVDNATLTFTLHDRIGTGSLVKGVDAQPTTLSFKKDEKREVSFPLPIPQRPQAYNAVSKITTSTNKDTPIANEISAHFVVRGLSATIQKVSLDTFSFTKGSIAKLSFEWTGPADNFPSFRRGENVPGTKLPDTLSATAQIVRNKNDAACSEEKRISLSTTPNPGSPLSSASDISVTADCPDPVVILKIVSGTTVLSEGRYVFGTNAPEEKVIPSTFSKNPLFYGIVIVIALLALFALYYAVRREGRKNLSLLVFILGSAVFLFGGGEAYADTDTPDGSGWYCVDYHVYPDTDFSALWSKDCTTMQDLTYCPGETARVDISSYVYICANASAWQWFRVGIPERAQTDYQVGGRGSHWLTYAMNKTMPTSGTMTPMRVQSRYGGLFEFDYSPSPAYDTWYPKKLVHDFPIDTSDCCTDTTWSPDPSTVCNDRTFTQTSNCGSERTLWGTRVCDGSCGTLATLYSQETTSWPSNNWCAVGTKNPAGEPPFPDPGTSASWTCQGLDGAADSSPCIATRTQNPICGPNERVYSESDTDWYSNTPEGFCSLGTVPDPLPTFNISTPPAWICNGAVPVTCAPSTIATNFTVRTDDSESSWATSAAGTQGDDLDFQWTVTPNDSQCMLIGDRIFVQQQGSALLNGVNDYILGTNTSGGDYTLQCTYDQPDTEDAVSQKTVNVTATCTPTAWSPWGNCAPACDDDEKGDQKKTRINGSCEVETESQPCNVPKCQPGGFKEIPGF